MSAVGAAPGLARARESWWFGAVPLRRIALLRAVVYLFIPLDVVLTSGWVREHAAQGPVLYEPLTVARWLHLPAPSSLAVNLLAVVVVASAVAAATGRRPRITGTIAGLAYLGWMVVAMSYGKVDHDRFAFLIALAVLPTIRATSLRASQSAGRWTEQGAWALRCVQLAVVATYFLASWSKIRFGGLDWPTGATLERALLRRDTVFSSWMLDKPQILVPMQFAMIGAELLSPLVLLARSDRARTLVAFGMWAFHLSVFAGVTIIFLPHCVAIAAFVPLERLDDAASRLFGRGPLRRPRPVEPGLLPEPEVVGPGIRPAGRTGTPTAAGHR
ncbi:MAG: conserved rane protein of unknown function [Jatrophihabitantaceae bacterium]|nr:conserved rane protein of unknown function [Jatrophihabitantaceae bacterium]